MRPDWSSLAAAPAAYRAGVTLGFICGMRVGEILGLTPNRVDFDAGTITIDRQWQYRGFDAPITRCSLRTIAAPELVIEELRRLAHPSAPGDRPLLAGPRGGTLQRIAFYQRAWRPALLGAGLASDRYVFLAARHYAIASLLTKGVSPVEVAAYVGDSVRTIASAYSHWLSARGTRLERPLGRSVLEALTQGMAAS